MTNKMKTRLDEQLRIYKDSPQVTATYMDLAHIIEDMMKMAEEKEIGFNQKEKK